MRRPPHLPFLNGAPSLAPGLAPIAVQNWFLPDTEADAWLTEKHAMMRGHRDRVYADQGDPARWEPLLDLMTAQGVVLSTDDWPTPLERAAASVSDDLCLMVRGADGVWRLEAASLCAPSGWVLAERIGQPLSGLHGPVPGAEPVLVQRISRMFDALRGELLLERFNWTVQAGAGHHAPDAKPFKRLARETADEDALDVLHLRVERQTLRKLINSNTILFTIRICIDPIAAALADPLHRRAFEAGWADIDPDLASYKGWPSYERLVREALKRLS